MILEPGNYTFRYQVFDAWEVSQRMKEHAIKVNAIEEGKGPEMIADVTVPARISYPDDSLTTGWKRKSDVALIGVAALAGVGLLWAVLRR